MRKTQNVSGQKIISSVEANMKAEGFSATTKVKNDCHAMLSGKVSANKLVKQYVAQYKK